MVFGTVTFAKMLQTGNIIYPFTVQRICVKIKHIFFYLLHLIRRIDARLFPDEVCSRHFPYDGITEQEEFIV